ncbi:MAG: L-seryl-tRNA(Sec) selenium transferase [Pseudomonadales bacterium]
MNNVENRQIASVDRVLSDPALQTLLDRHGRERVKSVIQQLQAEWRTAASPPPWSSTAEAYRAPLERALAHRGYQRVINLTGTVIHTNLGRAPLPQAAWDATSERVLGPSNLEFDLQRGRRGQREASVVERLCALTGAPAATVVNNTAAALVLMLNTLALGKEVPVSRGELIEIGGSFRLPDIMRQAGCLLREVGTTNRTHLRDYEAALSAETGLLLKVHPSNYHIAGFTKITSLQSLAQLAKRHGVPLCEDLGSGTLIDLSRYGLPKEPTPDLSLRAGANLVTFSGDKLLGGVQAGIVLGDKQLIDSLNSNPLKRALRLDKVALNLLDEVLKLYESPETLSAKLPVLRLLTATVEELGARATALLPHLARWLPECEVSVAEAHSQIGSGAMPDTALPTRCLRIAGVNAAALADILTRLRSLPTPIIGRLQQDAIWLDMRCAESTTEIAALLEAAAP